MSEDKGAATRMENPLSAIEEAARQVNICNACRYCEGYCAVFPAILSAHVCRG